MHHILPTDQIPLDLPLFKGIDPEKLPHVLSCLRAHLVEFDPGDAIIRYGVTEDFVAYLLEGSANGVSYDEDGTKSILHVFAPGQVISCGRVFNVDSALSYDVIAHERCRLVYFTTVLPEIRCEHCARYVNIVKANLAQSIISLNEELMVTLDIRRRRTSRGKIIAFLEVQAQKAGSNSFDITFNRQELADYLCIDRCALSRELSRLHEEGQVDYSRNHFELHLDPSRKRMRAKVS
jgi:CRP-like cAMP-binding protein